MVCAKISAARRQSEIIPKYIVDIEFNIFIKIVWKIDGVIDDFYVVLEYALFNNKFNARKIYFVI